MSKTLGQVLREARQRAGLRQKDVAQKVLGDDKYGSMVYRWETDRTVPNAILFIKISRLLNLSLSDYPDEYTVHRKANK